MSAVSVAKPQQRVPQIVIFNMSHSTAIGATADVPLRLHLASAIGFWQATKHEADREIAGRSDRARLASAAGPLFLAETFTWPGLVWLRCMVALSRFGGNTSTKLPV